MLFVVDDDVDNDCSRRGFERVGRILRGGPDSGRQRGEQDAMSSALPASARSRIWARFGVASEFVRICLLDNRRAAFRIPK